MFDILKYIKLFYYYFGNKFIFLLLLQYVIINKNCRFEVFLDIKKVYFNLVFVERMLFFLLLFDGEVYKVKIF